MKLSDRIRTTRRMAKLSQVTLACLCGVGRSAVANWESATGVSPASKNLMAIAHAAQVSFDWLATGRGRMQLPSTSSNQPDATPCSDPYERRLVQAYRSASPRMRLALLEVAEEMALTRTEKRERQTQVPCIE